MPLYSSTYLKDLSSRRSDQAKLKLFTESRKLTDGFDIFLSHSFLDKDEVEGLYIELTDLGFRVYVDWIIDPHLDRKNVTRTSAELIRKRMRSSRSLLLAISTSAVLSKWIPWELGYVDGNTNRCAIIPVSKERIAPKTFDGKEYLRLYPFIKKLRDTKTRINKLWVIESAYSYSIVETWLKTGVIKGNQRVNILEL